MADLPNIQKCHSLHVKYGAKHCSLRPGHWNYETPCLCLIST